MVEGLATELLCSVCDEVCKRGAQMKCCGVRACRACAVLKINKTKKCWNEDCGQEDITANNDLKNDDLLRKAVEYFNKNGKMDPKHEKLLKKTRDGKTLEKKKIGKGADKGEKKAPVDVAERFNQPCGFGEKCKRKRCLFVHDKPTLGDKKAAAELREKGNGKPCKHGENCTDEKCKFAHPPVPKPAPEPKEPKAAKGKKGKKGKAAKGKAAKVADKPEAKPEGDGKPCRFGALCTKKDVCKFTHPKINKPCKFGAKCTQKGCKFDHSPSSKALDRAIGALKGGRGTMGARGDLRSRLSQRRPMERPMGGRMGGGMGPMGGMGRMPMGGGMGGMGGGMGGRMASMNMAMDDDWDEMGGRNTNLAQMQKMKHELEGMMANVMDGPGQMRGGYGSSSMGGGTPWKSGSGPTDRMGGYGGGDGPMRRGYGAPAGRYNF